LHNWTLLESQGRVLYVSLRPANSRPANSCLEFCVLDTTRLIILAEEWSEVHELKCCLLGTTQVLNLAGNFLSELHERKFYLLDTTQVPIFGREVLERHA